MSRKEPTPRSRRQSRAPRASCERKRPRPRQAGLLKRIVFGWWDRIFGAAQSGSFSEADEVYSAGQTRKDFVWNTVGLTAWGVMFPVFTVLITQVLDATQAGMFSLAFVTANVLMIIGTYGVRPYQCSDLEERHSFADYRAARIISCAAMLVLGLGYSVVRGYSGEMLLIQIGVVVFRLVDGLADVCEGRLQQMDKLYLSGISQALRSIAPFAVFAVLLVLFRSLSVASIGLAVTAVAALVVVTLPLALLETPKSRKADLASVKAILKQCFPLFVGLFFYTFIDNMPKFAMDGVLDYDNQLYFNALYFPAQTILLIGGFVYKPLIGRMTAAWHDRSIRNRFDLLIVAMFAVIVVVTVAMSAFMWTAGIPLMGILYGVDFEQFRGMCAIMLVAGGVTGGIDFLYQVTAIIRHQKAIMRLYAVAFAFSLVAPFALIRLLGLYGACVGYLVEMLFLFALLLTEYVRVRLGWAPSDSDPSPIMARR